MISISWISMTHFSPARERGKRHHRSRSQERRHQSPQRQRSRHSRSRSPRGHDSRARSRSPRKHLDSERSNRHQQQREHGEGAGQKHCSSTDFSRSRPDRVQLSPSREDRRGGSSWSNERGGHGFQGEAAVWHCMDVSVACGAVTPCVVSQN
jgi:cyclin L